MSRLFATLLMLIPLVFSQGVHEAVADVAPMDSRAGLTDMHSRSDRPSHEQEHRGAPLQGCHHSSSCSQSFLVNVSLRPARSACHSGVWPAANEQNPRAIIVDRDPPVPRSLA